MRFGLNTFATFLDYFGSRKVQSSSNDTRPHSIFAPRDPRIRRSRSARLHRSQRVRQGFTTAGPRPTLPPTTANQHSSTVSGTGTAHGVKQRGTKKLSAGKRSALSLLGSLSGDATPPSSPSPPQTRSHRGRSSSSLPSSCPVFPG